MHGEVSEIQKDSTYTKLYPKHRQPSEPELYIMLKGNCEA